jgi:hypothetical protein
VALPIAEPAVDWAALLDVLWASVVGGVGVTGAFAIAILGTTRAAEQRRNGNALAAGAYGALAAMAFAAVVVAVALGILFITQKD